MANLNVNAVRLHPSPCLEAVMEPLRRQGRRILFYLDNLLILSRSEESTRTDTTAVIEGRRVIHFPAVSWSIWEFLYIQWQWWRNSRPIGTLLRSRWQESDGAVKEWSKFKDTVTLSLFTFWHRRHSLFSIYTGFCVYAGCRFNSWFLASKPS